MIRRQAGVRRRSRSCRLLDAGGQWISRNASMIGGNSAAPIDRSTSAGTVSLQSACFSSCRIAFRNWYWGSVLLLG